MDEKTVIKEKFMRDMGFNTGELQRLEVVKERIGEKNLKIRRGKNGKPIKTEEERLKRYFRFQGKGGLM